MEDENQIYPNTVVRSAHRRPVVPAILRRSGAILLCVSLALIGVLAELGVRPALSRAPQETIITDGNITGTVTWSKVGSPYIVQNTSLYIVASGALTIEAGVEVQFDTGSGLYVEGRLNVAGSPTQPVTLTSLAASPQPGSWVGVHVYDPGSADIQWCRLAYAGGMGPTGGLLLTSSKARVAHCVIEKNLAQGVDVHFSGDGPTISDTLIQNNQGPGIILGSELYTIRLENVQINDNQGAAIMQGGEIIAPTYRNLSASGNLTDAVVIEAANLPRGAQWDFSQVGIPVYVNGPISLPEDQVFSIAPGSQLNFGLYGGIYSMGSFYALGKPQAPISFTGQSPTPGAWGSVYLEENSRAVLDYNHISFGGSSWDAQLVILSDDVIVQNSVIRHSSVDGVRAWAQPVFIHNQVFSNTLGLSASPVSRTVDARYNWWGDASGPYHFTMNPNGKGNAVSDNVLFSPWLTSPVTSTQAVGAVYGSVAGPQRISPGETVDYVMRYHNLTTQTITTPLILTLPGFASYVESSNGGIFWGGRNQVFWRNLEVKPGESALMSARLHFDWGLPDLVTDTVLGLPAVIYTDGLQAYTTYTSTLVTEQNQLSQAQVDALMQSSPDFKTMYDRWLAEGLMSAPLYRITLSDGAVFTRAVFIDLKNNRYVSLQTDGQLALSFTLTPANLAIEGVDGGEQIDRDNGEVSIVGGGLQGSMALNSGQPAGLPDGFMQCMWNCIKINWRHVEGNPMGNVGPGGYDPTDARTKAACAICAATGDPKYCDECTQGLVSSVPPVAVVGGFCNASCLADPKSYNCTTNRIACKNAQEGNYWTCNTKTGALEKPGRIYCFAVGNVCVEDVGCRPLTDPICREPGQCYVPGKSAMTVARAKDPNAKAGQIGNLLPGQLVTYTVSYENVGQGRAYGVYILDTLDEDFDASTLNLMGAGSYISSTRTLVWLIGELPEGGQPGASGQVTFTVRLKPGLPGGTLIVNQAVVHFPSVPEETPTNVVVNLVEPLVAVPQRLSTLARTYLNITLSGRDLAGAPLTYALVSQPANGFISGTLPHLTYTPLDTFAGQDRFSFKVDNGVMESLPAEVSILVQPSPLDDIPPEVAWTWPASNTMHVAVRLTPVYTTPAGPVYSPLAYVGFSEPMSATYISTQTVKLLDSAGRTVNASLSYDGTRNQVLLKPHQPLTQPAYTIWISGQVQDLIGNPMGQDYAARFYTSLRRLFYPIIFMKE